MEILREVRRVLRKDGVCFWDIGDSYAAGGGKQVLQTKNASHGLDGHRQQTPGLESKQLCMIPFRVALAAQADGWWVRSVIIWAKQNPMPESVTDRPTTSHEYILLLTKSADYYYDAEAVKESVTPGAAHARGNGINPKCTEPGIGTKQNTSFSGAVNGLVSSRNLRSVWTFPSQPFPEAHFATFPEELVRRCVAAGTSERGCCAKCAAPWTRIIDRKRMMDGQQEVSGGWTQNDAGQIGPNGKGHWRITSASVTNGWSPMCTCGSNDLISCTVLDPFSGSGTTVEVARKMGRRAIGIDLSEEYLKMGRQRVGPLLLAMNA